MTRPEKRAWVTGFEREFKSRHPLDMKEMLDKYDAAVAAGDMREADKLLDALLDALYGEWQH